MSVEQVGAGGPVLPVQVGAWALVIAAALVALGDRGAAAPVSQVDRRPDPAVTVVEHAVPPSEVVRRRLAHRWGRNFDALLADLPVPTTARVLHQPASPVRSSSGRTAGWVWRDHVTVGAGQGWLLAVEVTQQPPWRHTDPCLPERWGMPGGAVHACTATTEGERLGVRATSSPRDAAPDPGAPGWTYVVDVRDGVQHVQLLLTRRHLGADAPPLTLDDLHDLAVDRSWYE